MATVAAMYGSLGVERGALVVVVLQDGRQLEGTLHAYTYGYVVDGVRFAAYEVDDMLPLD